MRANDVSMARRVSASNRFTGLILAHTALGTPFVVITVAATLKGFDDNLARAAASLGAALYIGLRHSPLPSFC